MSYMHVTLFKSESSSQILVRRAAQKSMPFSVLMRLSITQCLVVQSGRYSHKGIVVKKVANNIVRKSGVMIKRIPNGGEQRYACNINDSPRQDSTVQPACWVRQPRESMSFERSPAQGRCRCKLSEKALPYLNPFNDVLVATTGLPQPQLSPTKISSTRS